jgi:hypothetical protein
VLPGAEGVDKFDVDHLGAALLGILNYALGCAHLSFDGLCFGFGGSALPAAAVRRGRLAPLKGS